MDAPANPAPLRRWHQRRLLRYLAVLLLAFVGAYFVWDMLFMPADLRRLQGSWRILRITQDGEVFNDDIDRMVMAGRRISVTARDPDRRERESYAIDIVPEQHELLFFREQEMTLFGTTIRLPAWLKRGETYRMRYELDGSNLTLRLPFNSPEPIERRFELVREDE